uniref:Uncharacterized protein n=1 Tax=Oncorhynchus tshawytscha TaxID=74940 RepID=A0A8C8H4H0_ONCTS
MPSGVNTFASHCTISKGCVLPKKKKGAAVDQKTAALVHTCPVSSIPSLQWSRYWLMFKQHLESKHPKSPMVPVLVDVQAAP